MLKITTQCFEDLSKEEQEFQPNNGTGKECASYLRVEHNSELIALKSDAMEPEDAEFGRNLAWIRLLLLQCYELGVGDSK